MKNWKPEMDPRDCVRYYGNMHQLCGIRQFTYTSGRATGLEAAEVDTGAGLRFTVLPGRGMDIPELSYKGIPIAYLTKGGVGASTFYDATGDEWLRNFFAGMLTTCGLGNAGPACRGDVGILKDVPFGLHGVISNTCADDVSTYQEWEKDRYVLRLSGRMEEGRLHGEHLQMRRTIETALGEKQLTITDTFTNKAELPAMLMFFYHINVGHPVLGPGAKFIAPSRRIWAETEHAKAGLKEYADCTAPQPGYLEQQFFHDMMSDEAGNTFCALINEDLELGVCLEYNIREMPCIAQWKVLRDAEYVLAFEPGNCHAIGREKQIAEGKEEILSSLESRQTHYTIRILDGKDEIEALKNRVATFKD